MGNILSNKVTEENNPNSNKKRPFVEDNHHGVESKRRKKSKSTSQYIYNALFVGGEGSDVVVQAFGRKWRLHKVYLKQAQFFSKMFDGKWKETNQKVIDLQIPDDNVNEDALNTAFGSLYSDDIEVSPDEAESILAAASLIQLEGLMQTCAEVMTESVCVDNVWGFYESSRLYGQETVEKTCVEWLENNLMIQSMKGQHIGIDPALMSRILNSPKMFVVQVEMDVYTMLRKWLYYRINHHHDTKGGGGDSNHDSKEVLKFFRDRFKSTDQRFLQSEIGREFIEVFQAVRFCNIIRDYGCCREIEIDGIIPLTWLVPLYRVRWLEMLKVEQGTDRGPSESDRIDSKSLRCGRQIMRDVDHCWRWNGYNFGVDLLISYNSKAPRSLMLKRNVESHHCVSSVNLVTKRNIIYNLRVFSLDQKGHVLHSFSTAGDQFQSFSKDEERIVMTLGDQQNVKLSFPLMISATFKTISDPIETLPSIIKEELWTLPQIPQSNQD